MRKAIITYVLDRAAADAAPWNASQAQEMTGYFDKCWHLRSIYRESFIDMRFLHLKFELCCPFTVSNGSLEGGNRHWDSLWMHGFVNKELLSVVQKVTGLTSSGHAIPGLFADEYNRLEFGQDTEENIDRTLRKMKARLAFLLHSDGTKCSAVCLVDDELAWVVPFHNECIARHAEGGAQKLTAYRHFPEVLQGVRDTLSHGLEGRVVERMIIDGEECYALHRRTGRCACISSIKSGVCSAKGPCKHKELELLVTRAASSMEAFCEVEAECLGKLRDFLWKREMSKPLSIRQDLFHFSHCVLSAVERSTTSLILWVRSWTLLRCVISCLRALLRDCELMFVGSLLQLRAHVCGRSSRANFCGCSRAMSTCCLWALAHDGELMFVGAGVLHCARRT